jgi:hypothetical protein
MTQHPWIFYLQNLIVVPTLFATFWTYWMPDGTLWLLTRLAASWPRLVPAGGSLDRLSRRLRCDSSDD